MEITQLWRYPVKSLAGEPLTSVQVEAEGLVFDRSYAIIDRTEKLDGTPFTARRNAATLSFAASVTADGDVVVTAPAAAARSVDDPSLRKEFEQSLNQPVSVMRAEKQRFHDAQNILVLNTASLQALSREWKAPVNPLRFRPNIIIGGADLEPFVETHWVGTTFSAGDVLLEGVELCERCVLPTIDPDTLEKSPDFLRLLVEKHAASFGLYCRVKKPGRMRVGDAWVICR